MVVHAITHGTVSVILMQRNECLNQLIVPTLCCQMQHRLSAFVWRCKQIIDELRRPVVVALGCGVPVVNRPQNRDALTMMLPGARHMMRKRPTLRVYCKKSCAMREGNQRANGACVSLCRSQVCDSLPCVVNSAQ